MHFSSDRREETARRLEEGLNTIRPGSFEQDGGKLKEASHFVMITCKSCISQLEWHYVYYKISIKLQNRLISVRMGSDMNKNVITRQGLPCLLSNYQGRND